MKPVKALLPVSKWLLRIAILAYAVLQYGPTILNLQYQTQPFFIAVAFVLFAVLLFAGGFTSKPSLTVVSALLLSLLIIYLIYLGFIPQITISQIIQLLMVSVCLYFVSTGNK